MIPPKIHDRKFSLHIPFSILSLFTACHWKNPSARIEKGVPSSPGERTPFPHRQEKQVILQSGKREGALTGDHGQHPPGLIPPLPQLPDPHKILGRHGITAAEEGIMKENRSSTISFQPFFERNRLYQVSFFRLDFPVFENLSGKEARGQ